MKAISSQLAEKIAQKYSVVPGLKEELQKKLQAQQSEAADEEAMEAFTADIPTGASPEDVSVKDERIIALTVGARPVARIRDNRVTTKFIGPDSESWAKVIGDNMATINARVPAVGRIELNNSDLPWVGTGWMIAQNIIVTNRHVAQEFCEVEAQGGKLVFKQGLSGGLVSSDVDFLEEENRADSAEHPVKSILWVAAEGDADVAFLRIERGSDGPELPEPIPLADKDASTGDVIGAIGYPARDPSIQDQKLMISIFGDDVYEKKRFSPGKVKAVKGNRLEHDCSTLGGNSGSVLLNLKTGEAVGLHHGGLRDNSANLGVTAAHLRELLDAVLKGEKPASVPDSHGGAAVVPHPPSGPPSGGGPVQLQLNVTVKGTLPLEVIATATVTQLSGAGQTQVNVSSGTTGSGGADVTTSVKTGTPEAALAEAKRLFGGSPGVVQVRPGYRFKNGWITDEKVIVLEVREKGKQSLPPDVLGIGLEERIAPLRDEAADSSLVATERPAKAAGYVEPAGYDDPNSDVCLKRVKEKMSAIFHVSPDSGFTHLTDFIGRVKRRLTATIYEWDHKQISDALQTALSGEGKVLKMVTQKNGVGGSDATETAVADMKQRLGGNFKHVFASVRGPDRLIPDSYHIKVASRDGEEVWLSSGNWKESNHPLPEAAERRTALSKFNREWHVIIKNERLAKLFQKYIDHDFKEATRVPLPPTVQSEMLAQEFFVPDDLTDVEAERVPGVTYSDTLKIEDEELDIQPLLTPDRDAEGERIFLKTATAMIKRARKKIYLQNQSFNFTDENNEEFNQFFTVLEKKQDELEDVRIICRDAKDYGRPTDIAKQQATLERLKDFGFKVSSNHLRLQRKCHTKGIIVDSKEVLIGSQNLTNGGALMNRDASLLVRSAKVAAFYEKIFLYDWEHRASNEISESVAGVRRAQPGEATPEGYRRMTFEQLVKSL